MKFLLLAFNFHPYDKTFHLLGYQNRNTQCKQESQVRLLLKQLSVQRLFNLHSASKNLLLTRMVLFISLTGRLHFRNATVKS